MTILTRDSAISQRFQPFNDAAAVAPKDTWLDDEFSYESPKDGLYLVAGNNAYNEKNWQRVPLMRKPMANREPNPEEYTPLDHSEELAWLDAHTEQVSQYAGQWIALVRRSIVAVADTLREVRAQASEKGHADPLLVPIPPVDASYL